ncbi:hypothetical protein [Chryseobacterium sp. CT-SW4]|uniref:hypothetical protein n=1 Tax=Chryseobacterium sp. SW-1 TaxID=3157343 RepID=UPI003B01F185
MKRTVLFLFFILASHGSAQYSSKPLENPFSQTEKWDLLGRDGMENVNAYEAEYFNKALAHTRKDFDFTEKKIGFITGNNAKVKTNKKEYFDLERIRISKGQTGNGGTVVTFTEEEKAVNGGYDAAILYWCKVIPQKKDLIETLSK